MPVYNKFLEEVIRIALNKLNTHQNMLKLLKVHKVFGVKILTIFERVNDGQTKNCKA